MSSQKLELPLLLPWDQPNFTPTIITIRPLTAHPCSLLNLLSNPITLILFSLLPQPNRLFSLRHSLCSVSHQPIKPHLIIFPKLSFSHPNLPLSLLLTQTRGLQFGQSSLSLTSLNRLRNLFSLVVWNDERLELLFTLD